MANLIGSLRRPRLAATLVVCAFVVLPSSAQQPEQYGINVTAAQNIDATGTAHVHWVMNFNPPRGYDRVRRVYPNLYVLFRDFGPERSSLEINRDTLRITPDDGQRSISFSADVWSLAVSRNNRWQIGLAPNEQVSTQDGNHVFTVLALGAQYGLNLTIINTYVLPPAAQNVQVDKENHVLTYTLHEPRTVGAGEPTADVEVRYKKRLMAALYKMYADPDAQEGGYWVAKTIFKNTGRVPIYNLKIYYKLGEYTDMSVPDAYSVVPAGGIVVDPFYPMVRSRVAQLRTPSPQQLYIRYEFKDAAGKPYSEELTRRLEILGINQFEFSNLNDEDRTDSWYDSFNNAPLLSAFVTPTDEVVKQFAGYVSEAAGGAPAQGDAASATRWLRAAYMTELLNNIVYQTPSSFLTPDHANGQDIKFPRDVFRDKSGTCVDLAIAYAAVAESVGLQAYLVVKPGHAFPVIRLPNGQFMAVESTGLGGGNQRMSFEQAEQYGMQELQKLQEEPYFLVDVQKEWSDGHVPNPELEALGVDFLAKAGIQRVSAMNEKSPGMQPSQPAAGQLAGGQLAGPAAGAKQFRVVHNHGVGNLIYYCIGILTITPDVVVYQGQWANDGRMDHFVVKKSEIREAKKNRLPFWSNGVSFQSFHIRLVNGVNLNFANISPANTSLSADPILMELMQ